MNVGLELAVTLLRLLGSVFLCFRVTAGFVFHNSPSGLGASAAYPTVIVRFPGLRPSSLTQELPAGSALLPRASLSAPGICAAHCAQKHTPCTTAVRPQEAAHMQPRYQLASVPRPLPGGHQPPLPGVPCITWTAMSLGLEGREGAASPGAKGLC